jgi:hypothetical protein
VSASLKQTMGRCFKVKLVRFPGGLFRKLAAQQGLARPGRAELWTQRGPPMALCRFFLTPPNFYPRRTEY